MTAATAPTHAHYLTVQDVLWINYQLTKRQQPFRYAALEAATYQQYGYGASRDVLAQASRLYRALASKGALDAGNTATAFIATVTYLALNGYKMAEQDGDALASAVASGDADWTKLVQKDDHAHGVTVREAAQHALAKYGLAAARLLDRP